MKQSCISFAKRIKNTNYYFEYEYLQREQVRMVTLMAVNKQMLCPLLKPYGHHPNILCEVTLPGLWLRLQGPALGMQLIHQ